MPFGFADFGWMNGQSRQTEFPLDGKIMTGMFTVDGGYNYDFSHPRDHTIVGSTSSGRSNEFQLMHIGVGGDFHWGNARGRLMTQLGLYSTMTPRNDGSPGRGQWTLGDAYKYVTEAYGGYHVNALAGINIDAGIFLSYVGLCSYYNYENWTDQASYVSSNTPWFFNGIRIQLYTSDKLKIEPWIINGWQSYGMFNEMPGLGVQVAYRPTGAVALVVSGYFGKDVLANQDRTRFHTDNSLLIKYYEHSDSLLSKAAFSLTVDAGCEEGGGVSCVGGTKSRPSQYFIGAMLYNRVWFDHNKYGLTVGGGWMSNPGRYLVLTPPINGATAFTGSPYFTQAPGDKFNAWDTTETFDWMPVQSLTLRLEYTHRWASVPYFAGPGGVTPQVSPGLYTNSGAPGSMVTGFKPDLQQNENRITLNMMVRI
ncbi:MAG TPA: outer membrane beta-barrel protein [Polyangiales bacterium]